MGLFHHGVYETAEFKQSFYFVYEFVEIHLLYGYSDSTEAHESIWDRRLHDEPETILAE